MSNNASIITHTIALRAAEQALRAGVAAAGEIGVPMSIVIVDPAGQLKTMVRMDGATILTFEIAYKKAWTSAAAGMPTASLHEFISGDAAALLSMPHVENLSAIAGGLPLRVQSHCVGGVGVSGATPDADLKVAQAVAAAIS